MATFNQVASEIRAHLLQMRPRLEGYEDLLRLDISDSARSVVGEAQREAKNRILLCQEALDVLGRLFDSGFPGWPERKISQDALESIQDQDVTIDAARATFGSSLSARSVTASISSERLTRRP